MKRYLLLAAAPFLLAPVRLEYSTPASLQGLSRSPAPESYSLPAATALTTPTIITVSPTRLPPVSPSPVIAAPSPSLPPVAAPLPPSAAMPQLSAELCRRAMGLTAELAMLSYQQKRSQSAMNLTVAATTAGAQASARQWPELAAFSKAANSIGWLAPQRAEVKQAAQSALTLCAHSNGTPLGNGQVPVPRPN